MAGPLRVAVIGCGDAGSAHATTVSRHPETVLSVCCDLDEERSAKVASEHGANAARTVAEVMADGPAMVIVSTGPIGQPAVVGQLAKLGFTGGLLCEKPLATSLATARGVLADAGRTRMTLAVNHQRRFGCAVQRAGELLRDGEIGELVRVEGYAADATAFDWAPHWIDVSFLLTGDTPVAWAQMMCDTATRRTHAGLSLEGASLMVWEHRGGVRGQFECGRRVAGQPLLRLLGTDGLIEIGSDLRVLGSGAAGWARLPMPERPLSAGQWLRGLDELILAMREDRSPAHSGARAVAALEVCLAGYHSIRGGRPVALPLPEDADIALAL